MSDSSWYRTLAVLIAVPFVVTACRDAEGTGSSSRSPMVPDRAKAAPMKYSPAPPSAAPSNLQLDRLIIVAIDSLNPTYVELDAEASGPGAGSDWLMPRVREFLDEASHWPAAEGYFPHATDMNHLNVVAASNSGITGIMGVGRQAKQWTSRGMVKENIHLSKARYPDGSQVVTLFDQLEGASGGRAVTAYIGNKSWVPVEYDQVVDVVVTGKAYPPYITTAPKAVSYYDNPATDPDHACDPESPIQAITSNKDPLDHPRDAWIVQAALEVLDHEKPRIFYILLGDLDAAQHVLGSVGNPAEWVEGEVPLKPGCSPEDRYKLVSRRNPQLYKEPILDLVRDVDLAFGALMDGIKSRPELSNATVVLVSDHNMSNFLWRPGIEQVTNPIRVLIDAGLAPARTSYLSGLGALGAVYYRESHKHLVGPAKKELLDQKHTAYNHETGVTELPWDVVDRTEMQNGRPDLGLDAGEFYHPYFVSIDVWPDLLIVMKPGWQLVSPQMQNAGHGGPDTASVMLAVRGPGFAPGARCAGPAYLSDVGATVAHAMSWVFPFQVGQPLTCSPLP